MVHGKNRIPYWIDRRLPGLAGPDYDAIISFGLPIEPEDSQYGEYRFTSIEERLIRVPGDMFEKSACCYRGQRPVRVRVREMYINWELDRATSARRF